MLIKAFLNLDMASVPMRNLSKEHNKEEITTNTFTVGGAGQQTQAKDTTDATALIGNKLSQDNKFTVEVQK